MDVMAEGDCTAATGTRSQPDYSECYEKDSTAPPPNARPGTFHRFSDTSAYGLRR